jgi:hypothetical protein
VKLAWHVKRVLIISVLALPLIVAFAFLIATRRLASVTDLPLPNPNGYDQFIKAAQLIQGNVGDYGTESEAELAALVDALNGMAFEGVGRSGLENLVNSLDAAACRSTALALEFLDSQRQTWDDAMNQEDVWQHRLFPGLYADRNLLTMNVLRHKDWAEARKKIHETQGKTPSLAVQFAARAYELDKGRPLTNITELVPAYLKAVPQDPVTGKEMVYPPR